LEGIDKTIEVMKAAMEKEEKIKQASESMDKMIDEHTACYETTTVETTCQEDNGMQNNLQDEEIMDADITGKDQISQVEATCDDMSDDKPVKSTKTFLKGTKNKELAAKDVKIQELSDRLMRSMAEFDNFRKRSEKEKSQMYDMGVKNIIEKLLPIIDNFERGLGSVNEEDKESPLVQGFIMIYKQLMTTIDEIGVKAIEAVGNEFDPNFHNAVMHGEDEELGENTVAEEYQKGYMYHDIVVRHTMVKVVN
jgi:molecular chaperone GrpE